MSPSSGPFSLQLPGVNNISSTCDSQTPHDILLLSLFFLILSVWITAIHSKKKTKSKQCLAESKKRAKQNPTVKNHKQRKNCSKPSKMDETHAYDTSKKKRAREQNQSETLYEDFKSSLTDGGRNGWLTGNSIVLSFHFIVLLFILLIFLSSGFRILMEPNSKSDSSNSDLTVRPSSSSSHKGLKLACHRGDMSCIWLIVICRSLVFCCSSYQFY